MWVVPPAEIIESAKDSLNSADPRMLADQVRELHEALGDDEANGLTAQNAYNLGLQAARTMLRGNPLLAMKEIEPGALL